MQRLRALARRTIATALVALVLAPIFTLAKAVVLFVPDLSVGGGPDCCITVTGGVPNGTFLFGISDMAQGNP